MTVITTNHETNAELLAAASPLNAPSAHLIPPNLIEHEYGKLKTHAIYTVPVSGSWEPESALIPPPVDVPDVDFRTACDISRRWNTKAIHNGYRDKRRWYYPTRTGKRTWAVIGIPVPANWRPESPWDLAPNETPQVHGTSARKLVIQLNEKRFLSAFVRYWSVLVYLPFPPDILDAIEKESRLKTAIAHQRSAEVSQLMNA